LSTAASSVFVNQTQRVQPFSDTRYLYTFHEMLIGSGYVSVLHEAGKEELARFQKKRKLSLQNESSRQLTQLSYLMEMSWDYQQSGDSKKIRS